MLQMLMEHTEHRLLFTASSYDRCVSVRADINVTNKNEQTGKMVNKAMEIQKILELMRMSSLVVNVFVVFSIL